MIPDAHREGARAALSEVVGSTSILGVTRVGGGASGAELFRVSYGDGRLLLRIEGPETSLLRRNPHRWSALRLAAAAGVAPRVHYVDGVAGVSVTDFIDQRPLTTFPGGAPALAGALGQLLRELQAGPTFPPLVDYRQLVADMLAKVDASNVFARGVLDPHFEQLSRLPARCPWDDEGFVSSHNDPNPGNILYDGRRLWLVDWEAGYANEPLIDLAIVSDALAPTPELEDGLLAAWFGSPADKNLRARFEMVRRLTRLYYACFLIDAGRMSAGPEPHTDASIPSPPEIRRLIAEGTLARGSAESVFLLGKVFLQGFLNGTIEIDLREAFRRLL